MVGTRIANPSSLPFNSGSTSPTAFAAPVPVGIIDWVAERARRRSEWKTSVRTWSLVKAWIRGHEALLDADPVRGWPSRAARGSWVVHDALEMTVCDAESDWWFTP